MDVVVQYADEYVFNDLYNKLLPTSFVTNGTSIASDFVISPWTPDNLYRQFCTVFIIVCSGGWFFYLASACASYYFIFDRELMKHPKFLKNQVRQEIACAVGAIPGFSSKLIYILTLDQKY